MRGAGISTRVLRAGIAGNPNSGKTSIFNRLTGSNRSVGNYPGVTVERHEGLVRAGGRTLLMVDLPGTYSLTAFSAEEVVAAISSSKNGPTSSWTWSIRPTWSATSTWPFS